MQAPSTSRLSQTSRCIASDVGKFHESTPPSSLVITDAATQAEWYELKSRAQSFAQPSSGDELDGADNMKAKLLTMLDDTYVRKNTMVIGSTALRESHREHFSDSLKAEEMIGPSHLQPLEKIWKENDGALGRETFHSVIRKMIDPPHTELEEFSQQMTLLFFRMDTNGDGEVDWGEFCTHLMLSLDEKQQVENQIDHPMLVCPKRFKSPHNIDIVRLLLFFDPVNRVFTFDEHGVICIWSLKMDLLRSEKLPQTRCTDVTTNSRVLDGGFLSTCNMIVVATSNSDLRFYDGSTVRLVKIVQLFELATSLSCWDRNHQGDAPLQAYVAWGGLDGTIHILKFKNCSNINAMFNKYVIREWEPDRVWINEIMMYDSIIQRSSMVMYERALLHPSLTAWNMDGIVTGVKISQDGSLVFSSSASPRCSFAITRTEKFVKSDIAKENGCSSISIECGVSCFDHDPLNHQLATGGKDCTIRLWKPYVVNTCVAELHGHGSAVSCLQFHSNANQLISMSLNEHIWIWDVKKCVCLNAIAGAIPHSLLSQAIVHDMIWNPQAESLLTIAKDEIAIVQMSADTEQKGFDVSNNNNQSISCMCLIERYMYLVTGGTGGTIATWKALTGEKLLDFSSDLGTVSITAIIPGALANRVISSDTNGKIIVWNVLSGTPLQVMQHGMEIAGVVFLNNVVFGGGWARKLVRFVVPIACELEECPIAINESPIHATVHHYEDISAVVAFTSAYVITVSFDGDVIVWSARKGDAVQTFNTNKCLTISRKQEHWTIPLPNPRYTQGRSSVDALVTLDGRLTNLLTNKEDMGHLASLIVSSHHGVLYFYQPITARLLGGFRLISMMAVGDSTTATICIITTNKKADRIFAADSTGHIGVFNITDVCMQKSRILDDPDDIATPTIEHTWRAHTHTISAVVYVESSAILATSATDGAIRLWSVQGSYLGTYGVGQFANMAKAIDLYKKERAIVDDDDDDDGDIQETLADPTSVRTHPVRVFDRHKINADADADADADVDVDAEADVDADVDVDADADVDADVFAQDAVLSDRQRRSSMIIHERLSDPLRRKSSTMPMLSDMPPDLEVSLLGNIPSIASIIRPQSRLGRKYDSESSHRTHARKVWRRVHAPPDISKASIAGLKSCFPYTALPLERSELSRVRHSKSSSDLLTTTRSESAAALRRPTSGRTTVSATASGKKEKGNELPPLRRAKSSMLLRR